ncbi:hypothetical protein ACHAXT_002903 [Thalassiosira profunda]
MLFNVRVNHHPSPNFQPKQLRKTRVHFTDTSVVRREYDFDWDLERDYWYSRAELKQFGETRFDEADVLRKERGIRTSSRNDADDLSTSRRERFIGDKITHALDDVDDSHEISVRGIEHFVHPVLQKEMVRRKKELKRTVVMYYRDPQSRRVDPKGDKLAETSAELSEWARNVATERGIKYCTMKRGLGTKKERTKSGHFQRGGGLLIMARSLEGAKGMRHLERDTCLSRASFVMNVKKEDTE